MKTPLLAAGAAFLVASAHPLFAQAPAAPATKAAPLATPKPRPPIADDKQLLFTGSFELPRVPKRSPHTNGGDPLPSAQGEWVRFGPTAANQAETEVVIGLSNETSYTGKQSVYVDFKGASTPQAGVEITSSLIPVKGGEKYHVNLWGRTDPKNPLILGQAMPNLRLQVDFYQADATTQTGESLLQVQPIPGTPRRPLFFTPDRWSEYYVDPKAPDDAAFIKVSWTLLVPNDGGKISGGIFLDDLGIRGEHPTPVAVPKDPAIEGVLPALTTTPGTPTAPGEVSPTPTIDLKMLPKDGSAPQ